MNTNILQFAIRMKDLTSNVMASVARNTHTSTVRITNDLGGIVATNRKVIDSYSQIAKQAREAHTQMGRARDAAGRYLPSGRGAGQLSTGTNGGGFNPLSLVKGFGAAYVAQKVASFGIDSVMDAMMFKATEKSFGVLAGDAGRGKALSGDLNKLQQDTILGPEVFKAAQTMQSFGVATEKVIKLEKELGDISIGNKDKFESLSLAISQVTAAGRLQGQDLLQFVNAGFNPLQVMSEKWQQFGFSSKKSMGDLKEMMERGQITAAAVEKSLDLATSAGGKFAGMMDTIAKEGYGKLQILEGKFENFKIQTGESLMPVAESLMNAASKTLDWLDISKTAPETLTAERASIGGLVSMITTLNESNSQRRSLLDELVTKYPELYGGIDKEKIKNNELLDTLYRVNDAYQKRIDIAGSQLMADTNSKLASNDWNDYIHYQAIASAYGRGDEAGARSLMSFGEKLANPFDSRNGDNFSKYAQQAKTAFDMHSGTAATANNLNAGQQRQAFIDQYRAMSQQDIADKFKGRDNQYREFMKLGNQLDTAGKFNFSGGTLNGLDGIPRMQALLNGNGIVGAAKIAGTEGLFTEGKGKKSRSATEAAQGIVGGGPRQVIINGVKFADKIEVNMQPGEKMDAGQLEQQFAEMYLRILNSGAKVQ